MTQSTFHPIRQMTLHECTTPLTERTESQLFPLKLLIWNIRNPSLERAKRQADWMLQTGANVIILTEAKCSQGCLFLSHWLESYGFVVFLPTPPTSDYCVMVATKGYQTQLGEIRAPFLPHRLVSVLCTTEKEEFTLLGLYVPSRGAKEKRNVEKRMFQEQITNMLENALHSRENNPIIIAGDLNVVERTHIPHHAVFGEWEYEFYEAFIRSGLLDAYRIVHPDDREYSWFGRKGDGYRFDHAFISREWSPLLTDCQYIHEGRTLGLSDHSALFLTASSPQTLLQADKGSVPTF